MNFDNAQAIRRALRLVHDGYADGGAPVADDAAVGASPKGFSAGDGAPPQHFSDAVGASPKGFTPSQPTPSEAYNRGQTGQPAFTSAAPPPAMYGGQQGIGQAAPATGDMYQQIMARLAPAMAPTRSYQPSDFRMAERPQYTFNPATDPSRIVLAKMAEAKAAAAQQGASQAGQGGMSDWAADQQARDNVGSSGG